LAFLILLLTISTYGQTKKKKNEGDTTRQWEIGLDLLWLVNKNLVPSTSLFARYNFVNKYNQKRAWRFRLGVNNKTYDSAQINDPRNNEINIMAPYVRLGYEWQKDINEKASYFYGTDIVSYYSHKKTIQVLYPGSNLLQATDETWGFGVSPFIGFKYRPISWLALSAESSLNFMYRIRRERDKVTDINFPNSSGLQGKIDVNDFNILFSPITVINLSFYFNKYNKKQKS